MSVDAATRADLGQLLGPQGPIARALGTRAGSVVAYEERPQQQEMATLVADALSSGRHALLEAGTGVGKSFAYLVPLLRWAEANDAKVAVATSTIALQEQLVRKDVPLLAEALPFEVQVALVKGRANYLCLRRMEMAAAAGPKLFDTGDQEAQLGAVREWAKTTKDGSRQDLPFHPAPAVWEEVRAEQGNCLGRRCQHYDACHYQRSRRRAHAARLLVLNHHVLMADLALRRSGASFLPKVDAVVIDEAHDFEDTAAAHLGARVSARGVLYQLGRLSSRSGRKGLLGNRAGAARAAVDAAREATRTFFGELEARIRSASTRELAAATLVEGEHLDDALSSRLRALSVELERDAADGNGVERAMEIRARASGIADLADAVSAVARDELPGQVRWVELGGGGAISLRAAPVDVGPMLGDVLWDRHDSVILTSATLCAGRPPSFNYMRGRLGLEGVEGHAIGSPFDYHRQVRIVVRGDVPDPGRDPSGYERSLPAAVLDAVRRTRGGAFVLFTSRASMLRTAAAVRDVLEADGLRVLVQGEGLERPALLERFREGDAVLFGVASFWQGVDVPGEALRHVVIARLPFEVPTHPLQVARARRVSEADGDPFRDLSLPAAALRLKQGFGRLIRHSGDRGMVTVLDPRIVTRGYGRYLLESLPECPVEIRAEEA